MGKESVPADTTLAQDYAECFADLGKGKALYNPVSSSELRPGSVGFFDHEARWHNICNLDDEASLKRCSLTAATLEIRMLTDRHVEWREPFLSKGIAVNVISNQAEMGSRGVPAQASVCYQYVNGTDFGACLVVSKDVVNRRSDLDDGTARLFADTNARVLWSKDKKLIIGRNLRKYDLCVIGETWTVRKYTLTAWRGRGNAAHLGFNIGAQGIAGAQAEGLWIRGNSAGIWQGAEVDPGSKHAASLDEPEERLVVFACGIRLTPSRFGATQSSHLRSGQQSSGQNTDTYPISDEESVEVQWQVFGQLHGSRGGDGSEDGRDEYGDEYGE